MSRLFQHLLLNKVACQGLREAIRPLAHTESILYDSLRFCKNLYAVFYTLESAADLETVDLRITVEDIMLINNFVSVEDGAWAKDILSQTRQVFYELQTGKDATSLISAADTEHLLEGIEINLEKF